MCSCAWAANGHVAEPATTLMKSRRLMAATEAQDGASSAQTNILKESYRCPLWVKSRHVRCTSSCPLYYRKRHQMRHMEMSVLGHKQTLHGGKERGRSAH